MKREEIKWPRPHGIRDFELVRAGPDGAYWHAADGMVVRVAAAEHRRAPAREVDVAEAPIEAGEIPPRRARAW